MSKLITPEYSHIDNVSQLVHMPVYTLTLSTYAKDKEQAKQKIDGIILAEMRDNGTIWDRATLSCDADYGALSTYILPKFKVEELFSSDALDRITKRIAIISITSEGTSFAEIHTYGPIIKLCFDDVEESEVFTGITERQATLIADFIYDCHEADSISTLVVQCEAGVSRSSAIVAAYYKWCGKNESEIINNPNYIINKTVFNKVFNKLNEYDSYI